MLYYNWYTLDRPSQVNWETKMTLKLLFLTRQNYTAHEVGQHKLLSVQNICQNINWKNTSKYEKLYQKGNYNYL